MQAYIPVGWPLPGFAVFILATRPASPALEKAIASDCNKPEAAVTSASNATDKPGTDADNESSTKHNAAHRAEADASSGPNKKRRLVCFDSSSNPADQQGSQHRSSSSATLPSVQQGCDVARDRAVWLEEELQSQQLQTRKADLPSQQADLSQCSPAVGKSQAGKDCDSALAVLTAGQVGEVAVAGAGLASGYYRSPLTYITQQLLKTDTVLPDSKVIQSGFTEALALVKAALNCEIPTSGMQMD